MASIHILFGIINNKVYNKRYKYLKNQTFKLWHQFIFYLVSVFGFQVSLGGPATLKFEKKIFSWNVLKKLETNLKTTLLLACKKEISLFN